MSPPPAFSSKVVGGAAPNGTPPELGVTPANEVELMGITEGVTTKGKLVEGDTEYPYYKSQGQDY